MRLPLPPAHVSEERTQRKVRPCSEKGKKVCVRRWGLGVAEELEHTQAVGGTGPEQTQQRRSLASLHLACARGFETLQAATL